MFEEVPKLTDELAVFCSTLELATVNQAKVGNTKNNHTSTRNLYRRRSSIGSLKELNIFSKKLDVYAPIILISYLAFGTGMYIWREDWSFWNSLYFCVVSLLTVGYGDFYPSSDSMKVFTVFFVYCGISFVAGTVGVLMGRALSSFTEDGPDNANKCGMSQNMREIFWSLLSLTILGTIGTCFYYFHENMDLVDAFYFTMITLATVGYGDQVAYKQSSRIFSIFFVFFGVSVTAFAVGRFATVLARVEQQKQIDEFIQKGVTAEVIEALDADGSGDIDRAEFLEYMLVQAGVCKQSDVRQFNAMFASLDTDGGGTLDMGDYYPQQGRSISLTVL